mmetsp:Transcript_36882/g.88965  ORF Transcript_36882/g.88965 Transcript_36882/m.88965 type:complete len:397 (-) Transcript_36882:658-1848(-)
MKLYPLLLAAVAVATVTPIASGRTPLSDPTSQGSPNISRRRAKAKGSKARGSKAKGSKGSPKSSKKSIKSGRYTAPSSTSSKSATEPERSMPMHMQRKAKFHLNKATQESDSIKQNIEFMVMAAQSRKGFNFRCNDDEEQTRTGYSCSKMDQLSFISNAMLGSRAATYFTNSCGEFDYINDIWGYESSISNKKYAIAELWDGTSFVDISGRNPIVVGFLERAGDIEVGDCNRGFWADVKVVGGHAYIGSEQKNSGIQIFDLARLDSLPRPTTPQPLTRGGVPRLEADAFIATIGALHNFIEFPELGQLLAVGYGKRDNTAACSVDDGETVAIFDVSVDPLNPTVDCLNLGTLLNTENRAPYALMNTYPGYVHDGQCFIYNGPDTTYAGVSMCIFFC